MRWFRTPVAALLGTVAVTAACTPTVSDDPDLLLTSGVIYPLGASDDPVPAVAIRGGAVLALGSDAEVLQLAGRYTQQMNLDGAFVLPGTYDAWIDLEALGRWSTVPLDVRLASSVEEVQAMVRNVASTGGWIIGWGWDENEWPAPVLPDRRALDAVTTEQPVVLLHRNGQTAWLNSAGLAALPAGMLEAGGEDTVVRASDGQPTGVIAGTALRALDDALTGEAGERAEWLGEGARRAASRGITRAGSPPVGTTTIEALIDLEDRGLLPLRVDVRLTPQAASTYPGSNLERRVRDSSLVAVTAVGQRLDGPLASRLGAVDVPYRGGTSSGLLTDVAAATTASIETGMPLHLHASGDRAVALALDAIATTRIAGGMVVGFDLLPEEGASRATGLDIAIAAARFTNDIYRLDGLLGPERTTRAHAWRDLLTIGASLSFASDAPAYEIRPLASLAVVLTRQDSAGYPAGGWNASQTIPRSRALRALIGERPEETSGLVAGGTADLVIWSEDPLFGDPAALRRAEAMLTIVAGRVAYSRALVDLPMGTQRSR